MDTESIDTAITLMWVAAGLAAGAVTVVGIWLRTKWSEVLELATVCGAAGGGLWLVVSGMFLDMDHDLYMIIAYRGLMLLIVASVLSGVMAVIQRANTHSDGTPDPRTTERPLQLSPLNPSLCAPAGYRPHVKVAGRHHPRGSR